MQRSLLTAIRVECTVDCQASVKVAGAVARIILDGAQTRTSSGVLFSARVNHLGPPINIMVWWIGFSPTALFGGPAGDEGVGGNPGESRTPQLGGYRDDLLGPVCHTCYDSDASPRSDS